MGIFDKAKDLLGQHNETIDQGIDRVADLADERTGGQHGDKIDQASDQIKNALDEARGSGDSTAPADTPSDSPSPADPPANPS